MDVRDSYVSRFAELEASLPAVPALAALRRGAIDTFRRDGFPSAQLEDWRYTNVAPMVREPYQPVLRYERNGLAPEAILGRALAGFPAWRLVFIDGHFQAEHSALPTLPDGIEVGSLRAAVAEDATASRGLGAYASAASNGFVALNTAFLQDGALVRLRRGAVVDRPIHFVFVTSAHAERSAVCPRVLIWAEDNTQATVIESHVSVGPAAYLCSAVTEIVAGANAQIEHVGIVRAGADALHVASLAVQQAQASQVTLHAFVLEGGTVRNDVAVKLDGEGAGSTLNGLLLGRGNSHLDSHTTIDHAQPACQSEELYKGILDDSASGVFKGLIRVQPHAQKTVARQTNKNLLLSRAAQISTKPQLEIYADDVKCNHGSTIGQLDDDAVFYLRARGLDLAAARQLLTFAFAAEMITRVRCTPLREKLEEHLRDTQPGAGSGGVG